MAAKDDWVGVRPQQTAGSGLQCSWSSPDVSSPGGGKAVWENCWLISTKVPAQTPA